MATTARIMLVDDEGIALKRLRRILEKQGYLVSSYTHPAGALKRMKNTPYDLVVTDMKMPGMDGMELMIAIKTRFPAIDVILMTGYASIDNAIEATREGAFHYLQKPFTPEQFLEVVENALNRQRLRTQAAQVKDDTECSLSPPVIIGNSPKIRDIQTLIHQIAPTDCSVLISGDSGTGKELVARSIHLTSTRSRGPFVAVNCGAFTETLLASELFGHEKGAFTGAVKTRAGLLETANMGTVFLDEIGEMPHSMQVQLLRVLQEGELVRVGGTRAIPVDIRVLSATAKDLKDEVGSGGFRKDMYYRINVVNIHLPALHKRSEDIPLLAYHILDCLNRKGLKQIRAISSRAMSLLKGYAFPGNVRELENILERAVAISQSNEIRACDLPADLEALELHTYQRPEKDMMTLAELERDYIAHLLNINHNAKTRTAQILGIDRASLWRKIKKFGLES
ncbi:DNA-binding transcriptional response regulator, NtrC family, contains REC, AAA-type ATPase, and a Fis-type DNA-binding domains [Desulfocicer vacuolatum DSM 3385]|uniref:DNA-binding transcriptional response regulator, NtrC family, contains REC, AAA-type ATPase, and a Fis-type DNA-binding domains n=1 Tax=Desulfocicer vacuolatum DSM 3385 TaxID=1121400 RepID=A0A1W2DPM0_9BACT|nr:sigma-54 dependent transcriptional regulator [Desulfocicer vacuolatum]SMC99411.1 DNA-binding transcriptional response regulator, NtrC family, contains REC, AAA-type ATPase, and a Fis-type DNA-binding domains [Desulfocicer vacuolatum DSM 3385]